MQSALDPAAAQRGLVMLIEDDPDHALLIRAGLETNPRVHDVRVIGDGEQALELIRAAGARPAAPDLPALVLLDLKLPRVDGLDILRAIRESPIWKAVPVVVLSTSGRLADVQACYASGANAYMTKVGPAGLIAKAAKLAEQWLAQAASGQLRPAGSAGEGQRPAPAGAGPDND